MTPLDLDANATEPLRPEARAAVLRALDLGGNASSVHGGGRAARALIEAARAEVARHAGAAPAEVVFTSGGTEANAMALHGLGTGRRLLVGATEHAAIRAAAPAAETIPVRHNGTLDLDALAVLLANGPPALVCAMAANNETGVRHPLEAIRALCAEHGALLHVDAVQAAREDVPRADSLALSAHKLGGPPGAGALVLAPGLHVPPLIAGGGQERGRRGGTEALPAIAGFGAAIAAPYDAARIAALRDAIEAGLREIAPEAVIAGQGAPRLPNTSLIILPGAPAETQVIALDLAGVRVSAGAACSSGKVARSHVLEAMGFGELAGCGIRVSLPWNAPDDAPQRFLEAWAAMRNRLSSRARARAT
ncbi:cysteine desulfurase family protein [Roseococcus microcysteis]|uniref:cysteine desulfurase family protein n=1 Tax=Roseococcus microcysteis TaxID=2771361 RepID=UPI00168AF864|nr:aminotransferase class V-fold PLP-dependent enzyme [Roseococcus microcysteis]